MPSIRAQKDLRRAADFLDLEASSRDTGGLSVPPVSFLYEARPFAFKPPSGFLPSLRCHAADFAIEILYNIFMPIYRKGDLQFNLMRRASKEYGQREGDRSTAKQTVEQVAEDHQRGEGSAEGMLRGYDAIQSLREHRNRDISYMEGLGDLTIGEHNEAVDLLNAEGGTKIGNIQITEELPVSGDDLARGKRSRELALKRAKENE